MSLQNRKDLQDAIADWLNREDAGTLARIPDFITLAEKRIFRKLRCQSNEANFQIASLTMPEFTIPSDYQAAKTLTFDDWGLKYRSDQRYNRRTIREQTGTAEYFTRIGRKLIIWPWPDGADSKMDLWYYQSQTLGTQDTQTTQVLTDYPGLYLWGSLKEAAPFLKFQDMVPLWSTKYAEDFEEAMDDTWEDEYTGSTVEVQSVYGDSYG